VQRIFEEAAHTALAEMSVTFYGSRNPERIAWKDRVWEWFPLQLISAKTGTSVFPPTSTSKPATRIPTPATAFRQRSADGQSGRARFTGWPRATEVAHSWMAVRLTS
jgi:hypothetical protein